MNFVTIQSSLHVFWAVIYVTSAGSVRFIYDAILDGSACADHDVVIIAPSTSTISCLAICARVPYCRTIFYSKSTCMGCWKSYIKGDQLSVLSGSKHYKKQDGDMYIGCYEDGPDRVLSDEQFVESMNMTTKICHQFCTSNGKRLMLTEGGRDCFCGNQLKTVVTSPESDCSYSCSGNITEMCGGDWRGSVYDTLLYDTRS